MDVEQLLEAMTPEIYQHLQYATETGRWPDGSKLTQQQQSSCMQAVMLYQSRHNTEPQHMSVAAGGEMTFKSKAELKGQFSSQQDIVRVKVESK